VVDEERIVNIMAININKMKELLIAKREELTLSINDLQQSHPSVSDSPDSGNEYTYQDKEDDAVDAQETAQGQSIIATQRPLLDDINAALKRIENGTYGFCTVCGQAIPEKRLEALPWAALCIKDQAALDQRADIEDEVTPDNASKTHFS
jgi:DnaK suppressor protein